MLMERFEHGQEMPWERQEKHSKHQEAELKGLGPKGMRRVERVEIIWPGVLNEMHP
jgi:hypothetical protein